MELDPKDLPEGAVLRWEDLDECWKAGNPKAILQAVTEVFQCEPKEVLSGEHFFARDALVFCLRHYNPVVDSAEMIAKRLHLVRRHVKRILQRLRENPTPDVQICCKLLERKYGFV